MEAYISAMRTRCQAFVLFCFLLAVETSAHRTVRRFMGLPETGEKVNCKNASDNTKTLIVRNDLPGRLLFHESNELWIELVTSASKGRNNSNIKTLYSSFDNNTILLQVYKLPEPGHEQASETEKVLVIILSGVGGFVFLAAVVSVLCYFCYWRKRQRTKRKRGMEDTSKGSRTPSPETRSRVLGSHATPGLNGATPLMVVAVCACVMHAQLQTTNVEITVYFPSGFFRPDTKIFFNSENNNEIAVMGKDTPIKLSVFDVRNAGLVSVDRCSGKNLTCANGACDPLLGKCVCPRKMRANRKENGQTTCVYKCDEKCPEGSFERSPCNHTHPAVCKKCRSLCSFKEFESSPCAGKGDRKCTDISKLPQINVSVNVVHEDILKVKDDPPLRKTITSFSINSSTWLNRSSGLAVRLQLPQADFSTTFQEGKHDMNDNKKLPPTASSVLNYCSSPVPDYYEINLRRDGRAVKHIKGHPSTPCPSYDSVSSGTHTLGNLLFCDGSENQVVRLFGEKSDPEEFSKVERSRQCYDDKQNCEKCRDNCTKLSRANPLCDLTKQDVTQDGRQDFGAHFAYCFDCCFQANCTCTNCACSLYDASCIGSQVTCVETERFFVPIKPVFPNSGKFQCHVELRQGPVFELEATLWKDGNMLTRIENSERNTTQDLNGRDYGYMVLRHPSVLRNHTAKIIMVSGEIGKVNLSVGFYEIKNDVKLSGATQRLFIQPREPFKINSDEWPGENCQAMDTEKFNIVSPSKQMSSFKSFPQLTAHVAYEQNVRVFKVYNESGPRQVHVEMPKGRSILQYAFPKTTIINDRTFDGRLLKNRTFWTIRLRGRVSSCPGVFAVTLTDQDRPDVVVYHYDIAITNDDCAFTIEFHLPSGGDTDMIDKQFVVRLTDLRKTMKLILVSPRRIPEFVIPDFDDDFELEKLEVLVPFGGAAGGMLIVLVAILIYGYKTRPKDRYQRDRDNELHFRHLLFVVWFVGMRMLKSFLLTLTVIFVILAAIHHKNVKMLQQYKTFHQHQKSLDEEFIKQMDAHRVQEINRQWEILGQGKVMCDEKLKALNAHLGKHFKEMKEKLKEEMRKKSIILAASQRIERQFDTSRARFEIERKRLNQQMKAYSHEINSRLSKIQYKIENNFWLKAAKGMHKAFSDIAAFFGGNMKPFIQWVGLSVTFPSINVELPSFEDIFDNVDLNMSSLSLFDSNSSFPFWQHDFLSDTRINIQQITVPQLNISTPLNKQKAKELLALEWIVQLYNSGLFTTVLILLDTLWFVYRHSKTYQLAVILIHGFPKVYELEKVRKQGEKEEKEMKKKEQKLRMKAERKLRKENDEETSNISDADSLDDLNERSADELEEEQSCQEKTKNNNERKPLRVDALIKENIRDHILLEKNSDEMGVLRVDVNEKEGGLKSKRGKNTAAKKSAITEYKKTPKCSKRGKAINDGAGSDSDSNEMENPRIEEIVLTGPKRKRLFGSGLKGLDTVNTLFLKFLVKLKELNYQINNTNLVPLCLLSGIAILSVYVVIVTAKHSMNVETLDVIGYFDLKMAPILTMRKIVNTRITSNAFMVNDVHIPYYENRVNTRIAFYKKMAAIYQAYQCAKADLHNAEFCSWAAEPGASCDGVSPCNEDFFSNLTQFECDLEPVLPQRFTKFDRILYKEVHKKALAPYVAALRGLILDTFYMLLVVIGIFVVLKLLGMAVFVLLKKFDLVRQVKQYQANYDLKKEMDKMAVPHCIQYPSTESLRRDIGPVKISPIMKAKFGPLVREGQTSHWVGYQKEK